MELKGSNYREFPEIPFWEEYKMRNPVKANEIISLGIDLAHLTDKDVKEQLFALETTAKDTGCKISELKQKLLDFWASKFKETEYLFLVEMYEDIAKKEVQRYNLKLENTWPMILGMKVLKEKIASIEQKYKNLPARTSLSNQELLLFFALESEDPNVIFRKIHIYIHKYPMSEGTTKYINKLESFLDHHFTNEINPYLNNPTYSGNSLINSLTQTFLIQQISDKIKEKYEKNLVVECNQYDVSFYVELKLAEERVQKKFNNK